MINMELFDFLPLVIGIGIVLFISGLVIPQMMITLEGANTDKLCIKNQKQIFCYNRDMELKSVIITPSGLFGGSPYNKDACVNGNSQYLIEHDDVNWGKCKKK